MNYIKIDLLNRIRYDILALGAQSKSSFCFIKDRKAYLSEADGDLINVENFKLFKTGIKRLQARIKFKPEVVACDLHPEYISTKYARGLANDDNFKLREIQHHEAHIASCIVDNNIKGNVIGIAFDGTGLGHDGKIWGGEFFVGNVYGFKRVAHLRYIPMPGAEASVREPQRMALSYLYDIYGKKSNFLQHLTRLNKIRLELLLQIIDKKINTPLTSSMGRLFDAVSSIIGICDIANYEGQAAIELERILVKGEGLKVRAYRFGLKEEKDIFIIYPGDIIRNIIRDLRKRVPLGIVSLKFHNSVCYMIKDMCNILREKYKIHKVCLSGGVFQNKYLTENTPPLLEKEGFKVYLHKRLPAHDGNIALGQAILAGV